MSTVGVDLGGTKVLVASVHHGEAKDTAKEPTPTGGAEDVVAAIVDLVEKVDGKASKVGIGAPGQVRPDDGTVISAPNLVGWDRPVPLASMVSDALGGKVEVHVANDVNVAAYGEYRHGAGEGIDNLLGAWVGTGIGGGLVLDGSLRNGPTGMTGEIGHMTIRPGGRRCGCGLYGHVEAYAGRGSLEAEARRRHAAGEPTALIELAGDSRMKSSVFAKALEAGDVMVLELIDEAVEALGAGLASAANLVDLEVIVVGGGLADKLGATFVGRIEQAMRSNLWASSAVRVVPSALGDDAGVIGAAALASA